MRELSLYAGIGGGLLGSILLGHTVVGAVEIDKYCCAVLEQRQKDGVLDYFPIFQTDIRDFIRAGYADLYYGRCELVSGGFPCQPFSHAGKRKGAADDRNLWPETIDVVRRVAPEFCFFENVPGLLSSGYFGQILYDLDESGYDTRWRILSAAELGAPHKRDRLWIVAHANSSRQSGYEAIHRGVGETGSLQAINWAGSHRASGLVGANLAGRQQYPVDDQQVADADGGRRQQCDPPVRQLSEFNASRPSSGGWWETQPAFRRVVDEYAGRVAELRAAGNAQVCSVAAAAWRLLLAEL